jgi:DNA mismatch repair ATPase MutS
MHQWAQLKREQPQHVLMFQVGDFYEMLNRQTSPNFCSSSPHLQSMMYRNHNHLCLPPTSDAHIAHRVLGITLTRRTHAASESGSIPMAGVPVDSVNVHVGKFVAAGYSVAICNQVRRDDIGSSTSSSSLMQRIVSRVVTSGSAIDIVSQPSLYPSSSSTTAS